MAPAWQLRLSAFWRHPWAPLAAPVLLVAVAVAVRSIVRPVPLTFDGAMQALAGTRILSDGVYVGRSADFWPPLYPFLLGLGQTVTSAATAGTAISLLAALGVVAAMPTIARAWGLGRPGQIGVQLFIGLNPRFLDAAASADNNMLELLFWSLALATLAGAWTKGALENDGAIRLGLWLGLACLTRYTSYILPVVVLGVLLAWRVGRGAFLRVGGTAFVIALPWWIANTVRAGHPLATGQHINIGLGMATPGVLSPFHGGNWGTTQRWLWRDHAAYAGTSDLLAAEPVSFAANIAGNLWVFAVEANFGLAGWAFVGIPLLALGYWRAPRKVAACSAVLVVGSVFLQSTAFVLPIGTLPVLMLLGPPLLVGLGAVTRAVRTTWGTRAGWAARAVVLTILLLAPVIGAGPSDRLAAPENDERQEAIAFLAAHDPDIAGKVVMAPHPAWAMELGSDYLRTPGFYEGNLSGMHSYAALDAAVTRYAWSDPPFHLDPRAADYVVVESRFLWLREESRFDELDFGPDHAVIYRTDATLVLAVNPTA